ncbi:MAG: hypothetical protein PHW10_02860 [Candidatus Peribacteraceae bacterium]|nr:hypothetical protein [Candidatus Peribacteraceae bacterium]
MPSHRLPGAADVRALLDPEEERQQRLASLGDLADHPHMPRLLQHPWENQDTTAPILGIRAETLGSVANQIAAASQS